VESCATAAPGLAMNRFETWFCGSSFWLEDSKLGEHVLELGAGLGAATGELRRQAARVTSLEYDHGFAARLEARIRDRNASVIQGDAATLPFPDSTFSSVIAILMLHHLRSHELQDHAFAEICRVLRPGGVFLAIEIEDGWLERVAHIRSTFVPLAPASARARLRAAGFLDVTLNSWRGGVRIRAIRAPLT
jgi:ubiquinone/menaquinone biosynthesis C-methylase UbiE